MNQISQEVLNVFAELLNDIHDIFIVADRNWEVIYANKKACQYFNDDKELAGKNLVREFPVYKNSSLIKQLEEVMQSGKPSEFEFLSPFSKRWMYFRAYPSGNMLAVYSTDINLRKEAQRAIQQNQERYFNFIAQSTEGIWRCELEEPIVTALPIEQQIDLIFENGYLAECNDAMARMYGFNNSYDIMGVRLDTLLPKNEENIAYLTAFIEAGYKMVDGESKELAKDGSLRYFLNNFIGIVENGYMARAWGTQRDITELKLAEQKLQQTQTEIMMALQAGSAGTFMWDISSDAAQYGKPAGIANEKIEDWKKWIHPDDLPNVLNTLKDVVENRKALDIEFRVIGRDGMTRWILAKGQVQYDEQGRPDKLIGINIDITARKG